MSFFNQNQIITYFKLHVIQQIKTMLMRYACLLWFVGSGKGNASASATTFAASVMEITLVLATKSKPSPYLVRHTGGNARYRYDGRQ